MLNGTLCVSRKDFSVWPPTAKLTFWPTDPVAFAIFESDNFIETTPTTSPFLLSTGLPLEPGWIDAVTLSARMTCYTYPC